MKKLQKRQPYSGRVRHCIAMLRECRQRERTSGFPEHFKQLRKYYAGQLIWALWGEST